MFIVINCLGMPFNGDTIKTQSLGGSESAAYYLARELVSVGHEVMLFTSHPDGGEFDGVRYVPAGPQTAAAPLGEDFHFYAENTPHDVLIVQRHPQAFARKYASKVNLWWVHDLALHRYRPAVEAMTWNMQGVLCVSEYHKSQVCRVYGLPADRVHVMRNGVDLKAVADQGDRPSGLVQPNSRTKALYISRPERGLEHIVKPGGIAEQCPEQEFYFCAYDNTTDEMRGYYAHLYEMAATLPNVYNLGHLDKATLYRVMFECDLLCYPTPGPAAEAFREVSCIALMEAAACGLPVLTTDVGALRETGGEHGGVMYAPIDEFPAVIQRWSNAPEELVTMSGLQVGEYNTEHTWTAAAWGLERVVEQIVGTRSRGARVSELIRQSAVSDVLRDHPGYDNPDDRIVAAKRSEVEQCYAFYPLDSYADHYERYYAYEAARGVDYGPENMANNTRFELVCAALHGLSAGSTVLDYGCAHGHFTINLAKRRPDLRFIGVDIAASNIGKAQRWADDEGLANVRFIHGEAGSVDEALDAIICAEVLEHVRDPVALLNSLISNARHPHPLVVITTPFGPWEASGYIQHWPWRAHVHDFTRARIRRLFDHFPGFTLSVAPAGKSPDGDIMGSYVYSFQAYAEVPDVMYAERNEIDLAAFGGPDTVSLCMIVREDWQNLARCLDSVRGLVSEIVVRFDQTGDNHIGEQLLRTFAEQLHVPVSISYGPSPLEIGFDAARNETLAQACGDWILWLDSDEVIDGVADLFKYLRSNLCDSYAIDQHHFSLDPAGVTKTDHPVKLFRRSLGARFFGVVHEHPEVELNEGIGKVMRLPDVRIGHYGYTNEPTRRGRFARNYDLMVRDRKQYPERKLAKFLWLRDMAQTARLFAETGEPEKFRSAARAGVLAWRELLGVGDLRMIQDGLNYYNELVRMSIPDFVEITFALSCGVADSRTPEPIRAAFPTAKEAREFVELVASMKLDSLPTEDL